MTNQLAGQDNPLRGRLLPGEHVLWAGQPDRAAYTFSGSLLLIPFTLLWAGFAFFWEYSVITAGAPPLFTLWGIPFVLIGLYMVAGRFVVARRDAGRTWYMLTDRRVLLLGGTFRLRYTELDLRSLPAPTLDEGGRGVGTITFGPGWPGSRMLGPTWPGNRSGPAMIAVPNAGRVFRAIADAQAAAIGQAHAR